MCGPAGDPGAEGVYGQVGERGLPGLPGTIFLTLFDSSILIQHLFIYLKLYVELYVSRISSCFTQDPQDHMENKVLMDSLVLQVVQD